MRKAGKLLVALVIAASCGAGAEDTATPVTIARAIRAEVGEQLPLTGSTIPRRISMLSPRVAGIVTGVYVDDGSEVSAGDPIVDLDDVLAKTTLEQREAALEEARARQRESIRQRDEAEELASKQSVARTRLEETRAAVAIQAAAVARAAAEVREAEELLARHRITAPYGGVVTRKLVEQGEWVSLQTALAELVEMDVLRVEVPVPQHFFNRMPPGTPVSMRFDALPDRVFEGEVLRRVPNSSPTARTFPVHIDIPNQERLYAPGMSAAVTFEVERDRNAPSLLVPRDALVRKADGSISVWRIVQRDGVLTAVPVEVRTGRSFRQTIEITAGEIDSGDSVVVRGNELLRDGQSVTVIGEDELTL